MTPQPRHDFHSGFVGLAGVPNAGKSTLLNRLVGQKVSIVSRSPQSTRHRICGIVTDAASQLILVDMPGILSKGDLFNQNLVAAAHEALSDCDFIVHLRSADTAGSDDEARVIEIIRSTRKPVLEVWNKVDAEASRMPPPPGIEYVSSHRISARTGKGVDQLKRVLCEMLPAGPMLYPEDDISDRDLRFLAAEVVREKLFGLLRQEVPYGIATWTEKWDEHEEGKTYVQVVIQTEREAHKRIIIGEGGKTLKKAGSLARPEIEELCGAPIFLELWVKVVPEWRRNAGELARLGLKVTR